MSESGVKDFTAASYVGMLAPGATPPSVIAQLQKAVATALAADKVLDKLRELGAELATAEQMTPAGFGDFIRADFERSRSAVRLAGLTPQ